MGKRITTRHFMTGLAASGAALAILSTPVGLLEVIVTSTGLSEAIPAAAPPLGSTARALLALFTALMAAGVTLSFQKNSNRAEETADGDKTMGFALSKIAAFARDRARGHGRGPVDDMPVLRRADAHPDAPARRPIFASRDFKGVEIYPPADLLKIAVAPVIPFPTAPFYVEEDKDPIVDATGLDLPRAPEPLPDAEMRAMAGPRIALAPIAEGIAAPRIAPASRMPEGAEIEDTLGAARVADISDTADAIVAAEEPIAIAESIAPEAPVVLPAEPVVPPHDQDASVADLAARFERGLARRIALAEAAKASSHAETVLARNGASAAQPVLADIPAAEPVAVRADVDREIEQALRAALGTLHKMTTRAS